MKLVCFDCDSTLSAVEGVDELARRCGPEVYSKIKAMTDEAMEGSLRLEDVFAARLAIIRPTRACVEALGRLYVETIEPTARTAIAALAGRGWTAAIVSAGYRQAIRPLASLLGIERIEAVDLFFDADGNYSGYDSTHPATRSGGKAEILARLRRDLAPTRLVMVGDGASDLETRPVADLVVGFGRYTVRDCVRREADAFLQSLAELPALLDVEQH